MLKTKLFYLIYQFRFLNSYSNKNSENCNFGTRHSKLQSTQYAHKAIFFLFSLLFPLSSDIILMFIKIAKLFEYIPYIHYLNTKKQTYCRNCIIDSTAFNQNRGTYMKKKFFSSKIIVNSVVAIIVLSLSILINYSNLTLSNGIQEAALDEIYRIGLHQEQVLENAVANANIDLSALANYITKNNISTEDIFDKLNDAQLLQNDEQMYYIEPTGIGFSRINEPYDFTNNIFFQSTIESKTFCVYPELSSDSHGIILNVFFPIIEHGTLTGVFHNQLQISDFFNSATYTGFETSDEFIVDKDLNIIISTSSNHTDITTIPEDELNDLSNHNITNGLDDISYGISGSFVYEDYSIDKAMTYHPIEMTDFVFATNVEVNAISPILASAIVNAKVVSAITFWAIIVLISYSSIFHYYTQKKLFKTAYYDKLTGLPNVAKLRYDMDKAFKHNKSENYSIIIFDIENFKAINEMFGYSVGDKTLKAFLPFGKAFNVPSLILARISGDRFALFSGDGFLDDISTLINGVEDFFDTHVPELIGYPATYRIGRYHIPPEEIDFDDIMSKVNLAHTRAKELKGEFLCDYDDAFKKQLNKEVQITHKMHLALQKKEFAVYLQPKFSTHDNNLVGAEALIRWIEEDGNMIYPNDFIPLFERNGFIVELDKYVLETVCILIKSWMEQGIDPIPISVNCSRINLSNPFFVDGLVAIADKYSIPHESLEIELTESATVDQENTIEKLFADLKQNNFKISIDDFGSGYSSLSMLKNLNVNTLKMDRSFFIGGKNERRDDMLIDSIVKMSHNLGMYVVAEGIETQKQADLLRSMNCDAIQGYLYARPMPIADFEKAYKDDLHNNKNIAESTTPVIRSINDIRFASMFATCGLLITEVDDEFSIVEANDYFFDMIGYSRNEVRDLFNNKGIDIYNNKAKYRSPITKYFNRQMKKNPYAPINFTARIIVKNGDQSRFKFNGRMVVNEEGIKRLYFSVVDISDYIKVSEDLKSERKFVTDIVSLTGSAFFDFDNNTNVIRFSKNFSDQYDMPEVIEGFLESEIGTKLLPTFTKTIAENVNNSNKVESEFCIDSSDSTPIWHTFTCETYYDNKRNGYKTVGTISKPLIHKLETDILRVKSEADPLKLLYSKEATERYIRNYLRTATLENYSETASSGAFLVIKINNYTVLKDKFGSEYSDNYVKEVGVILRNTFRTTDIIGKSDEDVFYVFINNYKAIEFVKHKANELCILLEKTYTIAEESIELSAKIGISLYPEHGEDFHSVYNKADEVLKKISQNDSIQFDLYKDQH